jgi:hypothetical protein
MQIFTKCPDILHVMYLPLMSHTIMLTHTVKSVQFKDLCCWKKLALQLQYEWFICCAGKYTQLLLCSIHITNYTVTLFGYFVIYLFADFAFAY